jgi:hypothetical protein
MDKTTNPGCIFAPGTDNLSLIIRLSREVPVAAFHSL